MFRRRAKKSPAKTYPTSWAPTSMEEFLALPLTIEYWVSPHIGVDVPGVQFNCPPVLHQTATTTIGERFALDYYRCRDVDVNQIYQVATLARKPISALLKVHQTVSENQGTAHWEELFFVYGDGDMHSRADFTWWFETLRGRWDDRDR